MSKLLPELHRTIHLPLALILLALPAVALAQTYTFTACGATGALGPDQAACDTAYSGTNLEGDVTVAAGKQSWMAPADGIYRVTAVGAAGASATDGAFNGGRGAQVAGEFQLSAGDTLQIVVGQMGLVSTSEGAELVAGNRGETPQGEFTQSDGGGGGGSFVVDATDSPLLIAGGGGGTRVEAQQNGCDANTGEYGTDASGPEPTGGCAVKNSELGLGGVVSSVSWGSGGAGFNGDGEDDVECPGEGGHSWANGMTGGSVFEADGGFGGGGTGEGCNGGGGGGGYSGGDGGHIAGGGGSYNTGANPSAAAGVGTGDGSVTIEAISADLGVVVQESVDPVVAGSGPYNLRHELTVTNYGPAASAEFGGTLSIAWPAGTTFLGTLVAPGLNQNCPESPEAIESPAANPGLIVENEAPAGVDSPYESNWVAGGTLEPGDFGKFCVYFTVSLATAEGTDLITSSIDITSTEFPDPNDTNDSDSESTSVRWPTATFRVLKEYTSGGGGAVDVTLECSDTTGLLEYDPQSGTTTTSLTVRRFDIFGATTSCSVTEDSVPSGFFISGYSADCNVDPVGDQGSYVCTITNSPTRITFTVQKLFMLGHEMDEVEVNISCNTGLPLDQTKNAILVPGEDLDSPQTYEVEFVVTDFDDGELDCEVWETPVAGYIPSYECDIEVGGTCDAGDPFDVYTGEFVDLVFGDDPDDYFDGPCEFDDLSLSVGNLPPDEEPWDTLCVIRNYPAPTSVNIAKEWVIEGSSTPDGVSTYYEIDLYCDSPIIDVNSGGNVADYGDTWHASWSDDGDALFDASVIPGYPASECYIEETVFDDAVEVDSDCGDESNPFAVSVGNPYECTITNTIFYEGIPTLNQYGLALLALLMLGVGFVGFRRYS